jgi:hypothetical protein
MRGYLRCSPSKMFNRSLWLLQERWDLFLSTFLTPVVTALSNGVPIARSLAGSYSQIVAVKREVSPISGSVSGYLYRSTKEPNFRAPPRVPSPSARGSKPHFQYLKWSSKRLKTVMGRSSVRDFWGWISKASRRHGDDQGSQPRGRGCPFNKTRHAEE